MAADKRTPADATVQFAAARCCARGAAPIATTAMALVAAAVPILVALAITQELHAARNLFSQNPAATAPLAHLVAAAAWSLVAPARTAMLAAIEHLVASMLTPDPDCFQLTAAGFDNSTPTSARLLRGAGRAVT